MAIGKIQLPEYGDTYGDYEPVISKEIMRLHRTKHHQGYIDKANEIVEKLFRAGFEDYPALYRDFVFNYDGHRLHDLFWRSLLPAESDRRDLVSGRLLALVHDQYGAVDSLLGTMLALGEALQGNGWVLLLFNEELSMLQTISVQNHTAGHIFAGCVPLAAIDLWEHAYYLQYRNDKMAYLEAVISLLDWQQVSDRLFDVASNDEV
jgi:Fe-Mn family superoxide dismutase